MNLEKVPLRVSRSAWETGCRCQSWFFLSIRPQRMKGKSGCQGPRRGYAGGESAKRAVDDCDPEQC